jgi:ABC-type multidrug transport system fused ATPase/permease subunit
MIELAADISTKTAPDIILASIIGCLLIFLLSALAFRLASTDRAQSARLSRRADIRRSVLLIARFTKGNQGLLVAAFVLLSVEAVTQLFAWYPLAYMIDYFDRTQGPLPFPFVSNPRTATVAMVIVSLLLLLVINSACDSLAEIQLARAGRQLGFRLRVALFGHLQRLSLAFHDRTRKGDMLFRVVGDVKEFEQFVIDSVSDMIGSVLLLVATLCFIWYEAWQVLAVALIVLPGTSMISYYFSRRIKQTAKRQRAREGDLAAATQEMLQSIRVVKTFGRGGHDERRFVENSGHAMDAALGAAKLDAWFSWVVTVFEAAAMGATIWVGVYLLDHHRLSLGTLTLVVLLIRQMFKPSKRIIKQWNQVSKMFASVERIANLLEQPLTVHDQPGAVPAPPLRGRIELRDVTFTYQPDQGDQADAVDEARAPALVDVSLTIEPGQVVALTGPSGAGKTSIAQLVPRLYDPDRGAVLIDGRDVRGYTLDSLRGQISMVLQETVLLSGSVAENIAYGRPGATRDEIVTAAIRANAHEFIEALPDGYDTDLTEHGSNLSGGQRQRIAIARAFIRGTPIMILDEPTTGLDPASARQVLKGLRELMRGKTTLVASHDLRLLRSADRIVKLEGGRVVEVGTPEGLLEAAR